MAEHIDMNMDENGFEVDPVEPHPPLARPVDSGSRPPDPAFWMVHLFFQPRRFFEHLPGMATMFTVAYTTWILGVADVISRISEGNTKYEFGVGEGQILDVAESWPIYWAFCGGVGVFAAALEYKIGGWWYRARLRMCGHENPDPHLARRVYIFSSFIYALPVVTFAAIDSMRFSTPLAAENTGSWLWFFGTLACLPWSVYASYRGVRTLFEAVRWKARLWFFVLPLLFYLALVGASVVFYALAGYGMVEVPPDVTRPNSIERKGFSVSYPGNWWVDETVENYDPDHFFWIEPLQNAAVIFYIYDESADVWYATTEFVEDIRETSAGGNVSTFEKWGSFSGAGAEYEGTYGGDLYRVRVFTGTTESRSFTVYEWAHTSVADAVEPGVALIRNTFRLSD